MAHGDMRCYAGQRLNSNNKAGRMAGGREERLVLLSMHFRGARAGILRDTR